jgi:Ca2+-binding EF-hand superfamily protein
MQWLDVMLFACSVIFDFYDADGTGYITEEVLLWISELFYVLCFGDEGQDGRKARSYVKRLFQELDTNRDNKSSFEEFIWASMGIAELHEILVNNKLNGS